MYSMHKKCLMVEDTTDVLHLRCIICVRSVWLRILLTLCEINTSKMYSTHKKCFVVVDTTMTLCEIDTSKMYVYSKCHVRTN